MRGRAAQGAARPASFLVLLLASALALAGCGAEAEPTAEDIVAAYRRSAEAELALMLEEGYGEDEIPVLILKRFLASEVVVELQGCEPTRGDPGEVGVEGGHVCAYDLTQTVPDGTSYRAEGYRARLYEGEGGLMLRELEQGRI